MSFSQEVWARNADLYQATVNHPFNQELAAGTLDRDAFILMSFKTRTICSPMAALWR